MYSTKMSNCRATSRLEKDMSLRFEATAESSTKLILAHSLCVSIG